MLKYYRHLLHQIQFIFSEAVSWHSSIGYQPSWNLLLKKKKIYKLKTISLSTWKLLRKKTSLSNYCGKCLEEFGEVALLKKIILEVEGTCKSSEVFAIKQQCDRRIYSIQYVSYNASRKAAQGIVISTCSNNYQLCRFSSDY